MIYPQININGTHPDSLVDDYKEAYTALQNAIKALQKCMPHGRDYQINPAVYNDARQEHTDRIFAVSNVAADIIDLGMNVLEQKDN